jgi:hypothetical protein
MSSKSIQVTERLGGDIGKYPLSPEFLREEVALSEETAVEDEEEYHR